MSLRFGPIGTRGLALLAATGIVGVLLAAHGWTHRASGGVPGALSNRSATAGRPPGAAPSTASSMGPTAGTGPAPQANTTAGPGPLLASQPYAQYSFTIWPGTPSASAKAALTGLSVNVKRATSGISITAAVNGQQAGSTHFYRNGVRVYIVEASMGDDSGSSDYNLGDDGIVVTDARGRIVA